MGKGATMGRGATGPPGLGTLWWTMPQRGSGISGAVRQVVSESGPEGLTPRAAAAAAACTTGMVTHYFRDKKALLANARPVKRHRHTADRGAGAVGAGGVATTASTRCPCGTKTHAPTYLYAIAEQALPLNEERHLEAVVWSSSLGEHRITVDGKTHYPPLPVRELEHRKALA